MSSGSRAARWCGAAGRCPAVPHRRAVGFALRPQPLRASLPLSDRPCAGAVR
ncbi:hypothetical protein APASM_5142 [Actinosynnema pretiosum subsp. pretiosum]|nr:hypothetical protein APASM_5142 [Actinosynnema pretiosum subsp. pretiosum]